MGYVLDTSALVDAYRKWYAPQTIPGFWDRLEELAVSGEAVIPDAVLLELEVVDDGIYRWCKDHEETLVQPTTQEVQAVVSTISNTYPALRSAGVSGRNFADPIVIALAEHAGFAVVTHENATGDINGPRMPDVCRDRGIPVMQLYHMVQQLGWKFS